MNIIKISEQVFETIQNNNILPIDAEHLPYNKICVAFPYSFLRFSDDMIADSIKELKVQANKQGIGLKKMLEDKHQEIEVQKQRIINYCNADLHVIFNIDKLEITVKHSKPSAIGLTEQVLFKGMSLNNLVPLIMKNEMSSNGIWEYKTLLKLVSGVIYALNNRSIKVTEAQENYDSISNRPRKNYQEKIRYITNIKYINPYVTYQDTSYNKRVYNMDAWEVRGHWRRLQSGNKIWVNSYIKGDKEKLSNTDTLLKLNKIDIESITEPKK
jgi:hypothetical protein